MSTHGTSPILYIGASVRDGAGLPCLSCTGSHSGQGGSKTARNQSKQKAAQILKGLP